MESNVAIVNFFEWDNEYVDLLKDSTICFKTFSNGNFYCTLDKNKDLQIYSTNKKLIVKESGDYKIIIQLNPIIKLVRKFHSNGKRM